MASPINLNTTIHPTNNCKPGTVYGCSDPEFVGVMPVRQDITVLPADTPVGTLFGHNVIVITSKNKVQKSDPTRSLRLGWTVSETIGIGIVNSRAVSKLTKVSK